MDIYEYLDSHGIAYERYDHEAVYTCEQAEKIGIQSTAAKTKNLFLRDRKARRHFLIAVGADKTVDLKGLETVLRVKGLSFASPERLMEYLGLMPGAVTILSVINDTDGKVEVIVDEGLWQCSSIQSHPLVNTSTLVISREGIERFLKLAGHPPRILSIPGRLD